MILVTTFQQSATEPAYDRHVVWLNARQVVRVEKKPPGSFMSPSSLATRIIMADRTTLLVEQPLNQVLEMIQQDQREPGFFVPDCARYRYFPMPPDDWQLGSLLSILGPSRVWMSVPPVECGNKPIILPSTIMSVDDDRKIELSPSTVDTTA